MVSSTGWEADAALEKNQRMIFQILSHFQDAVVLQQRLKARQDISLAHLGDVATASSFEEKSSARPSPRRWPQGI